MLIRLLTGMVAAGGRQYPADVSEETGRTRLCA